MSEERKIATYPENANMKAVEVNTMKIKGLTTVEPADIETYDLLAGEVGAALTSANANTRYRSQYAEFRPAFMEALAKHPLVVEAGVDRVAKTETVTDDEGNETEKVTLKKDQPFFDEVCAATGTDPQDWKDLAQEVMDTCAFDPSPRQRGDGTPRVGKEDLKVGEAIAAQGQDKLDHAAAKLASIIGQSVPATAEGIAFGLQQKRKIENEKAKVVDELLS